MRYKLRRGSATDFTRGLLSIMEFVGLIVGVVALAGLFNSCIECCEIIRAEKSYLRDFELLTVKLNVEQTILLQWCRRVGLTSLVPSERDVRLNDATIQPALTSCLNCILALLTDTEALRRRYGCNDEQ